MLWGIYNGGKTYDFGGQPGGVNGAYRLAGGF